MTEGDVDPIIHPDGKHGRRRCYLVTAQYAVEIECSTDQCKMSEGLRKIAWRLALRTRLLRVESEVIRITNIRSNRSLAWSGFSWIRSPARTNHGEQQSMFARARDDFAKRLTTRQLADVQRM
jgi:hypothetical protein